MTRQSKRRATGKDMTQDVTVDAAAKMTRRIVLYQAGKCGGRIERALEQISQLCGVEYGSLKMLWSRPHELKSVNGRILDTLRHFDEYIRTLADRERTIIEETALDLEKRGSPAARIARKALEMAGERERLSA